MGEHPAMPNVPTSAPSCGSSLFTDSGAGGTVAVYAQFAEIIANEGHPNCRIGPHDLLTSAAPFYNIFVMEQPGYRHAIPSHLDLTFAALANPIRRAILSRLASGEVSVSELAEPFSMSQPAISRHLKVLERAGLISVGNDAQRRPRKLEAGALAEATDWLDGYRKYWEASFVRLDGLLDKLKATKPKRKRSAVRRR
jgi:DNA-binding transcriptional ArsR family regulator